ncbi:hypothetical protein [Ralstonia sp.]|uniref:hypothetical protein n=1 Tax=Ralstonia sp. TaxID=54061 RepID=UPI0031E2961F
MTTNKIPLSLPSDRWDAIDEPFTGDVLVYEPAIVGFDLGGVAHGRLPGGLSDDTPRGGRLSVAG